MLFIFLIFFVFFSYDKYMYLRKSLRELLQQIPSEYPGDFGILIYGETGTGKEVLAKEIHKKFKIKGEFVALDLTLLTQSLFEAELFGYKRGAFTGANEDKKGLIEIANGGTLFLDEISNLPLDLQAKLLRVLETKRFQRIGEIKESIYAGLTLVFKRVMVVVQFINLLLLGSGVYATGNIPENMSRILSFIPYTMGANLLKKVEIDGLSLMYLLPETILLYFCSLLFLLFGVYIFKFCDSYARKKGLIGQF